MSSPDLASPSELPRGARWQSLRDRALLGFARTVLSTVEAGRLHVVLPSGRSAIFGRSGAVEARLDVNRLRVLLACMRRGTIGFAESFIARDIDTPSLADVLRFFLDNNEALLRAGRHVFSVRAADRRFHRARTNSRVGSRRNILAHYDLGNAFYALWLDAGLTYSSGIYAHPHMTLAEAQAEKNARILSALDIQPGHSLLEIGCGWGGLAEAAARAGARVTAITLSDAQRAYAEARVARAGLADRVEVRLQDYRDVTGSYDRIASVEMIEAVGEEYWQGYFDRIAARLKAGGSALIQAITIRPESFPQYRVTPDFIQRYIFPGGLLPTVPHMVGHARAASLGLETIETFAESYARTLGEWRSAFEAAAAQVEALGFDERFRRMWSYYLTYCEVGFERGIIDVGHYRLRPI